MAREIQTVPNQRILTIHKEPTNRENKYTVNNLAALDEAAGLLQSKAGYKLYIYLAKNQDKYKFALSSSDFCLWAKVGIGAYNSAFNELKDKGYLVLVKNNSYIFYDKAQFNTNISGYNEVQIEIPKEKIKEIENIKETFAF